MSRTLLLSTALQTMTLATVLTAHAQPAPNARPTGGAVVAGSAAISRSATNTRVDQSTGRAAINWQSFDVGSQQSVTFHQPTAQSMTLNRVVGPDPSQIAGRINANGQLVIVNQSGMTFFHGAQVNTNGLMVSAAGISTANFMAGKMKFDQPARPNAKIDNRGEITIANEGLAALVAPQVANSGTITAKLGHVVLAGARTATLDLYGDGLLSLDVTNQVTQAPNGATTLVTNTGVIAADGGTVQLTARAADGVVQNLVQAGGRIHADTVGNHTGVVALNGVGGSVIVEGQLSARGVAPGTAGGNIEVAASGDVTLASTATVNASGQAGGGVIAIGTDLARARGGPSVTPSKLASNVLVHKGAKISADAITNGDGGHVTVLSANTTHMNGTISARGGAGGGNGGLVETSGKHLGVTGSVDAGAPNGKPGTWLLDPDFLDVISGPPPDGTEDDSFSGTGTVFAGDGLAGTPDTISNGIINASKFDVLLQATNTITVGANIDLTLVPGLALTLQAGDAITVSPGVSVRASGDVTFETGDAIPPPEFGAVALADGRVVLAAGAASPLISINGPVSSIGGSVNLLSDSGGSISIGAGGSAGAATITLNGGSGGVALTGNAVLGQVGSAIDITSTGPVSQDAGSTILANTLTGGGGVTGGVSLLGTANAINLLGPFTVTGGDLTVVNGTNLTLAGDQSADNLFYEVALPGGTLTLGQVVGVRGPIPANLLAAPGGRISLVADNVVVAVAKGSITTTGGAVEFAPFSPIAESLFGASGLIVDNKLLSITQTNGGTLDIGGFTNVPAGALAPAASAASIDVGGAADVNAIATTLRLDATGAISIGPGGSAKAADITLNSGPGGIALTGNAVLGQVGSDIDITSAGPVSEDATSKIIANTLTSGGGVTGSVSLLGTANAIDILDTFNVTAGDLTVVNGSDLTLMGTQSANNLFYEVALAGGTITLGQAIFDLDSIPANLSATVPGGRISLVADNQAVAVDTSSITTSGGVVEFAPFSPIAVSLFGASGLIVDNALLSITQTGGGTLEIGGFTNIPAGAVAPTASAASVDIGGAADLHAIATTLRLDATGAVSETGGPLTVANLAGTGGTWTLNNAGNAVQALGNITSSSSFSLVNGADIAVNGVLTAVTSAAITAEGTVTVPGAINAASVNFTANAVSETGSITTGSLTATAPGAVSLIGNNAIAGLGNVIAASFALNDAADLLIGGNLIAPNITIRAPANQVTLGDGSGIFTGGSARPPGPIDPALEPVNGAPGAYIQAASFVQLGSSTVAAAGGGPATLQIATTGNMQFDPPVGLDAAGAWLILDLTNGSAAGDVFVNALDVSFTVPGSANLFGTIAGIAGGPAAALGVIEPEINGNYLFNGCVIAAAVCQPGIIAVIPPAIGGPPPITGVPVTVSLSSDQVITSALGGLYDFLPGMPSPPAVLPNLVLVAVPMLPAPPHRLTDPDVVPPNITYLDY